MNCKISHIGLAMLCLLPAVSFAIPTVTPNTWTRVTQLPDNSAVNDAGNCGGTPCGRAWFPLEYHAGAGKTVVFGGSVAGGCGSGYINDVWDLGYDAARGGWQWTQRRSVNRGGGWPQGMDNHVMTYDADNQYLWILGGTCGGGYGYYDYQTNNFTQVGDYNSADSNEPHDGVFDPGFAWGDGQVVVFSGEPSWIENPGKRTSAFDTAMSSPAGWSVKLSENGIPPSREQIEEVMVYIPTTKRFLIFGGQPTGAPGSGSNDTWEYNAAANSWTEINSTIVPPSREMHVMVYDSDNDVVIMHGGSGRSDTWIYNPNSRQWSQLDNAGGPSRRLHGAAYDSANKVAILWSGKDPSGSDTDDLFVLRYDPSGTGGGSVASDPPGDFLAQ